MLARSNSEVAAPSVVEPMETSVRTFCWGDDGSGQCMGGARSTMESFVPSPTEVRMPPTKRDIAQLGTGWEQSFVILAKGGIWCGGANRGKCLSEEGEEGQFLGPQRLDRAEADEFEAGAIDAGRDHFVAVQSDGSRLLTWAASNEFGQAGQGDSRLSVGPCNPARFAIQSANLGSVRVCAVSCGENHTLALTEHGETFSWGSNSVGQLGLPDLPIGNACPTPRCVDAGGMRGLCVRQIAAGSQHSLVLGISGQVVSWGDNRRGRLGLGVDYEEQALIQVPARVEEPSKDVRLIAAGGAHSALVKRGGALLLAGDNRCGQLGHPPEELNFISVWVELPFREYGLKVRAVSLGEAHTLVLSYHGELFGVGANDRGQIGEPLEASIHAPRQVHLPDPQLFIWAVAAGPGHSMVLASSPPPSHRKVESPVKMPRTTSHQCSSSVPLVDDDDDEPLQRTVAYTGNSVSLRLMPPSKAERVSSQPKEETPWELRSLGCASKAAENPRLSISFSPTASTTLPGSFEAATENFVLLRPIVRPGVVAAVQFACLTVAKLRDMVGSLEKDVEASAKPLCEAVAATLRSPAMLASSFIMPELYDSRLAAEGLVRHLVAARGILPRELQTDVMWAGAVRQGLSALVSSASSSGVLSGFETRDQVRVLVLYLLIPDWAKLLEAHPSEMITVAEDLLRVISRLSLSGRRTFRDLIADECGNVAVFRDCLLSNARCMANAAVQIRIVEQRRTPQKGHVIWDCLLLLQLLWGAEARRLETARSTASIARALSKDESAGLPRTLSTASGGLTRTLSTASASRGPFQRAQSAPGAVLALPLSYFHVNAVIENDFPAPLELQMFMKHSRMEVIDPEQFFTNPLLEVDDKGDLPERMMSFMANGNLMPVSFKRRVLQAENEEMQREGGHVTFTPWGMAVRIMPFILEVRRDRILQDTVAKLENAAVQDLRRPLKVIFSGEEGIDEGGVAREYFRLLSKQLFSPEFGMFKTDEDSQYLWFDPGSLNEGVDFWTIGVLLGLAVYNNLPGLDVNLPLVLFKKLKGMPLTLDDFTEVFPVVGKSLQAVLQWEAPDGLSETEANELFEERFCLDFSVSYDAYGSTQIVSILPQSLNQVDGKAACESVTPARRNEFVNLFKEWWLTVGVEKQFTEFRKGFLRVCGASKIFAGLSATELEAIVCGERDLDFANLQKGAKVVETEVSFREGYLDDFWEILLSFDVMQKRQFLNFVTGSDLAPVGGLELVQFKIQRHGGEPTEQLPTSHTCFNLLTLPEYKDKEKLQRLLLMAIENAEGFGLQ